MAFSTIPIFAAARRGAALWCGSALLCMAAFVPTAEAAFIGDYALRYFTPAYSGYTGGAASPDGGQTLILTGPHEGDGSPGMNDLTIAAPLAGEFAFQYVYTSLDDPGFDYAGYLLGSDFFQFADTSGQSGKITVSVMRGEIFGFRVGTVDNIGEPGVLAVTGFSGPQSSVPEPGCFGLALAGLGVCIAGRRARRGAWVAVLAAVCAAGPLLAQSQVNYTGTNATGKVSLLNVVNLRQQAQPLRMFRLVPAAPETKPKAPPPRLYPSFPAPMRMFAQAATSTRALTITGPSGSFGFNALSHLDQRLANNGNQFSIEPPSQSIAVGNGYVLEGVNDAVQVYSQSGASVLPSVVSANQLFGLAPAIDRVTGVNGAYLTDMRVYFDQGISRWFVVQRSQDNDMYGNPLNQSHLYLAVSKTADPTGDYYIYIMDTTNIGHPGCPCLADYPQLGSDQYGFHIAWNEFDFGQPQQRFLDATILSLSKASLAAGAAIPVAYQFFMPFASGYEFAIQPATTPPLASNLIGSGGVEYLASTLASSAGSGVGLWALRNTSSLATGAPNLTLSRVIVPTLSYIFPDVATQRPGPLPYGSTLLPQGQLAFLDGGDPRVQSLSYAGARLYLSFQTRVTDENGAQLVGGAYVVLSPVLRNGVLAGSVLNQGQIVVNGNHLLRPALAVNSQGRGAIAVTLVGPDYFPTAALIPFETFSTPSTLQVVGPGAAPEDGFTGYPDAGGIGMARWGDYNAAVAAADGSIWLVAQYIGNYPRTEYANWNTFVARTQP